MVWLSRHWFQGSSGALGVPVILLPKRLVNGPAELILQGGQEHAGTGRSPRPRPGSRRWSLPSAGGRVESRAARTGWRLDDLRALAVRLEGRGKAVLGNAEDTPRSAPASKSVDRLVALEALRMSLISAPASVAKRLDRRAAHCRARQASCAFSEASSRIFLATSRP